MRIKPLRDYRSPDLSSYVVHLTGRNGRKPNSVPANICEMGAAERLVNILLDEEIAAFEAFGGASHSAPVVCFSECTPAGISAALKSRQHEPYGIAFHKDVVFDAGGGPVFYVRGDEWTATVSTLTPDVAARCVRYWPGLVDPNDAQSEGEVTWSEWTHEREWRVVCNAAAGFRFRWSEAAFLILPPDPAWEGLAFELELRGVNLEAFRSLPVVCLDGDGSVNSDPGEFWG